MLPDRTARYDLNDRTGPPSAPPGPARLLIISIQYAPEITGNAVLITGLARALAGRGHRVTVLAGTPHYRLPRVPPGYLWRPFRREVLEGVEVLRCWAFPRSDGLLAKSLNYASFTLTALLASLFLARRDAVLVVSPPFWLGLIGLLLKSLRGSPLIYNAQDLFPEAYRVSGEVSSGWLIRAMDRLMNFIYRRSDRITVIAPSFSRSIAAKGIDAGKIRAIPNFIDTSAVRPRPRRNPFSERHGLVDKFVVMYAGNIGFTHGTEMLVDAAERLAGFADLRLVVVGGGSKKKDLVALAGQRGLADLQFLGPQPPEALPDLLASADVFALTTKPGVGQASFPSRIYSYLLAARPVVASLDKDSDAAHLLLQAGAAIVTEPGNREDFCRAIQTLYHDREGREARGRRGREYMERHYSEDAIATQYVRLLAELLGECAVVRAAS